ncbi:MAG: hypothetical protein WC928_01685 [Patescibacteria group bacterium]|jgi:hypothetical protein
MKKIVLFLLIFLSVFFLLLFLKGESREITIPLFIDGQTDGGRIWPNIPATIKISCLIYYLFILAVLNFLIIYLFYFLKNKKEYLILGLNLAGGAVLSLFILINFGWWIMVIAGPSLIPSLFLVVSLFQKRIKIKNLLEMLAGLVIVILVYLLLNI